MLNTNVLVLNRSYLPVHVTTVRRAFTLIFQGTALAVNGEYETFDFESWQRQPAGGDKIGTPSGDIRVPRVIVLRSYDRVPRRHVRYSRLNIFARDKFTCQYCGNRPQGGRTPAQARLRLLRRPVRPRWSPMMHHIGATARHEEWRPFLHVVDSASRRSGVD